MEKPISVKYLLEQIKNSIEPCFAYVCVIGEVSNFRRSGKHWRFTLKEECAVIQCVIWFNKQKFIKYTPNNGDRIKVNGSVNLYVIGGNLTLSVTQCILDGIGDLHAYLYSLETMLRTQGIFDRTKRIIPQYPYRIGIIATIGGAALWDVLKVTKRRAPSVNVLIAHAAAQGDCAVNEIILALQEIQDEFWACDVILIVRGGGSFEDLWSYNSPDLVYAIANCRLPVITGIGHEIDTTLADLAADLRAATPSQAAELSTPNLVQLSHIITNLQERLINNISWYLDKIRENLKLLTDNKNIRSIEEYINFNTLKLLNLKHRFDLYLIAEEITKKLYNLMYRLHLSYPSRHLYSSNYRIQLLSKKLIDKSNTIVRHRGLERFQSFVYKTILLITNLLTKHKIRLNLINSKLKTIDPRLSLKRGFVLVLDATGKPITKYNALNKDSYVELQWLDGKRWAKIEDR